MRIATPTPTTTCSREHLIANRAARGAGSDAATPTSAIRRRPLAASLYMGLLLSCGLLVQGAPVQAAGAEEFCSPATEGERDVEFINNSSQPVTFHWMAFDCTEGGGPKLAPGRSELGITRPGHIFRVRGAAGQVLRHYRAGNDSLSFEVDDDLIAKVAGEGEPYTEGKCSPRSQGRVAVEFVNLLNEPIVMHWIGFDCEVRVLRTIPAHGRTTETTFPGHVFRFVDRHGRQLRSLDVTADERSYHIGDH